MMKKDFGTGMDVLLEERRDVIAGKRIGLVTHQAGLIAAGEWNAARMRRDPEISLRCLLGPEHGLFGQAGAGETVAAAEHPAWGIPIYSLYGEHRKPTAAMLDDLDLIVVDLQDLGVRCYTFVSTLYLVLEAAAELSIPVVVTDRPVPLPDVVDGPMRDENFISFVAQNQLPMVYGMTQGETARYFSMTHSWDLDLQVVPMRNYGRCSYRQAGWPPWSPPSTGIRSWESAWCYPVTVCTEALPGLDCDRTGPLPFQVLGATWMQGETIAAELSSRRLPGIEVYPHFYCAARGTSERVLLEGIRFVVTEPSLFRPVSLGLMVLETLQQIYGHEILWRDAREDFFDQLYGTDTVRRRLQSGGPMAEMAAAWREEQSGFHELRSQCKLYT
jgi:uncharacterized protein YbbC (DUF1343 family)